MKLPCGHSVVVLCLGRFRVRSGPFDPTETVRVPTVETTSLSPEVRLLLLTTAVPADHGAIREAAGAPIDWESLCGLADHEKAAPVVFREVERSVGTLPDPGYEDLQKLGRLWVMRMLQLERLLHETLDGLSQWGIQDVMLLKGAGLAYTAFASFTDRPMGDLDLLVRPGQAEHAWSLLQAQGWVCPALSSGAVRSTAHQHLPALVREPGGFRLELHDDLLPGGHPFRISTNAFWTRARRVSRNGRTFTIPHPLHQLWLMSVHFVWSHEMRWGSWRALRDGAALIRQSPVDWTEFVELARGSRAGSCCFWMLRLAQRLAGANVPAHVLDALRPPRSRWILEKLERHYVTNLFPSVYGCPSVWLSRRLWVAGIRPHRSGHGGARPWHGSEGWSTDQRPAGKPLRRPIGEGLRRLGAGLAYLRRLQRVTLPFGVR